MKNKQILYFISIIILFLFIIGYINILYNVPLFGDAATQGNIAKNILNFNVFDTHPLNYPPIYAIFQGILFSFFGDSAMNSIILIGIILLCFSIFLLFKELTDKYYFGIVGILIILASPKLIFYSARMYMEIFLSAFFIFSIFVFIKFVKTKSIFYLVLLSIFVGLTAAIKQQGLFILLPSIFISLIIITFFSRNEKKTYPKWSLLIFSGISLFIIILPYIILIHNDGQIAQGLDSFFIGNITTQVTQKLSGYHPSLEQIQFENKWGDILNNLEKKYYDTGASGAESRHIWPWTPLISWDGFINANSLYPSNFWGTNIPLFLETLIGLLIILGFVLFLINLVSNDKLLKFNNKKSNNCLLIFIIIFIIINYILFLKNNDQMRYHLFIPILLSFFIIVSINFLIFSTLFKIFSRYIKILFIVAFIILISLYFVPQFLYSLDINKNWDKTQLYSPSIGGIYSVVETGQWLNNHTNQNDKIWQPCWGELAYYSQRDFVGSPWYYFLNEKEINEIMNDQNVRYLVILDSQIISDDKWQNFCWVPQSFYNLIKKEYPQVYESSLGDIHVFALTNNQSIEEKNNKKELAFSEMAGINSGYDIGQGNIKICKQISKKPTDDFWSSDGGASWNKYPSPITFSIGLILHEKSGSEEKFSFNDTVLNDTNWYIDLSRSAKKVFFVKNKTDITQFKIDLKLIKLGNPPGNLTISINGKNMSFDLKDFPNNSDCSNSSGYTLYLSPDLLTTGKNELILNSNPDWYFSEMGNLHGLPLVTNNFFEGENIFRDYLINESKIIFNDFNLELGIWPNNYIAAFNLNFDDINCQNYEDFINHPENSQVKLIEDLNSKYPYLKTTLFFVPNPLDLYGSNVPNEFMINDSKCKSFLKLLNINHTIEIADHGLTHNSEDKLPKTIEFEFYNKDMVTDKLNEALREFNEVGIIVTGIRPPGWGMGMNLSLVDSVKEIGFKYIAGSTSNDGLNYFKKRVSNIFPEFYGGVLNIPQSSPMVNNNTNLDKIIGMNGLLSLKGHFYRDIDMKDRSFDGLTVERVNKLEASLEYLNSKYPGQIWYATMNEIADFWLAKKQLKISYHVVSEGVYEITLDNPSEYDLNNLSLKIPTDKFTFKENNSKNITINLKHHNQLKLIVLKNEK